MQHTYHAGIPIPSWPATSATDSRACLAGFRGPVPPPPAPNPLLQGKAASPRYCDVSLPVPLDQPFPYELPETLRHRVSAGCRVVVPFGPRRLTGVVLRVHDDPPNVETREALRLLDTAGPRCQTSVARKVDCRLLLRPRWAKSRSMFALSSEIRRGKIYSATDAGRDAARQLLLDAAVEDPVAQVLRALESRPLSAAYLAKKLPLAEKTIKSLEKRGFIFPEQIEEDRDPLRAASRPPPGGKLSKTRPAVKLSKPERELVAFLDLHPGTHNLRDLESTVKGASPSARSLARKKFVDLKREPMAMGGIPLTRAPHALNPPQQAAFAQIHDTIVSRQFKTFLLHGVTGSGKTEVYLNAIDTACAGQRTSAGSPVLSHPRHGRPILRPLRRPRRHPPQRLYRFRARRAVAQNPLRRRRRRRRDPLRRLRPRPQSGPDRCR